MLVRAYWSVGKKKRVHSRIVNVDVDLKFLSTEKVAKVLGRKDINRYEIIKES